MKLEQHTSVLREGSTGVTATGDSNRESVFALKKILVPVDFSPCSRKALAYAVPFAQQFQAELTLLHVIQPYPPIAEMGPVDTETIQDAKADLEKLQNAIPAPAARTMLRTGEPQSEILEVAKELEIDLIIVATHGRTGLGHFLLGSTTEKLVRHAPCPVLVVREDEHDFVTAAAPQ